MHEIPIPVPAEGTLGRIHAHVPLPTMPPALPDAIRRLLRRGRPAVLGAALGLCLAIASPLASPRRDHALLMELAGRELVRCQDDLAKLRRIGANDDQGVDPSIKTMAAQVAAATETDCKKLQAAIEAAAETEAERRPGGTFAPAISSASPAGLPSAQARPDAAPKPAAPEATQPPVRAPQQSPEPARTERPAAAQPPGSILAIHFLANSDAAAAAAKALVAQFGTGFYRVDVYPDPEVPPKALVRYSDQADHDAARTIARTLAGQHYKWRLERHDTAPSAAAPRTVEVWLPSRERKSAEAREPAPARR